MENSPSLIVKLHIKVCDTCTNVFSRWCEPMKPDWMSYYDHDYWTWTTDEKHFENRRNEPRWVWKVHELKSGASKCVCCRFLVQCLDASPWIVYGDEDYVELKSSFVGSTHTDLYKREMEDNSLSYRNSCSSRYERFHRPRLQLFKNTKQKDEYGRCYAPDDYLFILPFSQSAVGREGTNSAPAFQGRLVEKNIDFALANHWFTICRTTHFESELLKPKYYGSKVINCEPAPPKAIPHFRLADINERRIVLAEPGQEYAALSYVWGNSKKLLLRNDNLAQLSEPGALAQDNGHVPKTFRDALAVAAGLHIRYLWIDAICILQDDETQLLEHMNCMDQIYSAAVLTIVSDTTNADSGIPGVGRPREPAQATLQHGDTYFISSKRTFGRALHDSAWE
jgi:Heterokaryon incompatibility protein (HET)